MSTRAFDKIMKGIKEARAYLEGTADKKQYQCICLTAQSSVASQCPEERYA
jgi:hypothetical protein